MVERHPLEVNVGDSNSPRTALNDRGNKKSSIYFFLFRLKNYYHPYICENL